MNWLCRTLRPLVLLLVCALPVVAATWTTIDYPGADSTQALGINNNGDIVGLYVQANATHGFVYTAGTFTSIDVPGATQTVARGINDSGLIVGFYSTQSKDGVGFLFDGTTFTDLAKRDYLITVPYGINNAGDVVGYYGNGGSNPDFHGFKWSGGTFHTLEVGFTGETIVTGINNHGYITGYDPWSFDTFVRKPDGTVQTIPFPNPCCGLLQGINDGQALVGGYVSPSYNGFRLNGVTLKMIPLKFPGALYTYANGINNLGDTVGSYANNGLAWHGFLQTR